MAKSEVADDLDDVTYEDLFVAVIKVNGKTSTTNHKNKNMIVYLLVWVDDLVMVSSSLEVMKEKFDMDERKICCYF